MSFLSKYLDVFTIHYSGLCLSTSNVSALFAHPFIFLIVFKLYYCLLQQVVRAKKKDTGIVYALKIMDKKFITKENKTAYVKLERIVLDQLDHPGIIRLYFTFQDTFSLCRYPLRYLVK